MGPIAPWRCLSIAACLAVSLGCPEEGPEGRADTGPAWPASELVDVAVVDDDRVIVVASTGEIHLSLDAGLSWRAAAVSGSHRLQGIAMADARQGWAVGDDVILETVDGGSSWRPQRWPQGEGPVRLRAVAAVDSERALVVGDRGVRLGTSDAGRIWRDLSIESQGRVDSRSRPIVGIACARDASGRCASVGTGIHLTRDGGRSWIPVEVADEVRVEPVPFDVGQVDVRDRAAVGRLVASVEAQAPHVHREWRIEPEIGRADAAEVERRRDAQASFALIDARLDEVRSLLEAAGVAPDRVVVVDGPPWDYEDYLDEDPQLLQRYWQQRSAPESRVRIRVVDLPRLTSIAFSGSGSGSAVGRGGALVRSEDGGETWRGTRALTPHDLLGVAAADRRFVVVGAQGILLTSEDDGETWRSTAPAADAPFFDALRAVSLSPVGDLGFVVGERGRLLRSLDGGRSWRVLARDGRSAIDTPTQGRHSVVR